MADLSVIMAWKGMGGDQRIWWSQSDDGNSWTDQQPTPNASILTNSGPMLVNTQGLANPANDTTMYFAGTDDTLKIAESSSGLWDLVGTMGTPAGSFHTHERPAVAVLPAGGGVFDSVVAWRQMFALGSFLSSPPIVVWRSDPGGEAQEVATSSQGPALAVLGGQLIMVWKGAVTGGAQQNDDPRIFWCRSPDGISWSAPEPINNGAFGTSAAPALTVAGNGLYMAWKGKGNDPRLFWATSDGTGWSDQQIVRDGAFLTSAGPAIAVVKGQLILAWRGASGPQIWWSLKGFGPGGTWSDQRCVADGGVGTSDGPALASVLITNL